jgi:hypothetical protein
MITFSILKNINDTLSIGDEKYFIEYLNSFEGDNILEKYRNILKAWENDVSYTLSLSLDEKSVKVQLDYIINGIPENFGEPLRVSKNNMDVHIDIPKKFYQPYDIVPIYDIIHKITYGNTINLGDMDRIDRETVINKLPADIYTTILKKIGECQKIITYDNTNLKNISLNFLGNDPYLFLKGLFTPYGKDYYRDIIFHLSKRIDGNILLNSTMMDVEYYVEKLNTEQKTEPIPNLF